MKLIISQKIYEKEWKNGNIIEEKIDNYFFKGKFKKRIFLLFNEFIIPSCKACRFSILRKMQIIEKMQEKKETTKNIIYFKPYKEELRLVSSTDNLKNKMIKAIKIIEDAKNALWKKETTNIEAQIIYSLGKFYFQCYSKNSRNINLSFKSKNVNINISEKSPYIDLYLTDKLEQDVEIKILISNKIELEEHLYFQEKQY